MDILSGLNSAQAKAVQAAPGPVLVLAGPGSGKTRVLTHRIAYLIDAGHVRPHNVLAVTFTNKAAKEMIARLHALIGDDTNRLTMGTFHATCVRILRREAAHLSLRKDFVIYDADDQQRLIAGIIKEHNLDKTRYTPSAVRGTISRAKNELITPKTYMPPSYWHEAVARVFERYEALKAENNALDFDDLLIKAEELLRLHDDVRTRYQHWFQHVLVDEFQDTNKAQYELVRHLTSARRDVFVVGDEDQSIYSWRGADFRNVSRFRTDYPDAQVHLLEQNYRSSQTILDAARAIIACNIQRTDKKLWTSNGDGPRIQIYEAYDEREEAEYVVAQIQRLAARGDCRFSDCAVMFRTNAQSRVVEDVFTHHGIPYQLVGSTRFYQRREIKDVLAYLRLVHTADDGVALARIINVPPRRIGRKTIAQLEAWAAQSGLSSGRALVRLGTMDQKGEEVEQTPFAAATQSRLVGFGKMLARFIGAKEELSLAELLEMVLEETGYVSFLRDGSPEGEDRANNVRELLSAVERYAGQPTPDALASFLEEVTLVSDVDEVNWQSDTATVLTLHAAKGLEFEAVFVLGREEGICPHSRSMDTPDEMEEERRLCYVGVTRAKRHLHLLRTFRRTLYGENQTREPSRFLRDIPSHLVEGNVVQRVPPLEEQRRALPPRDERRALISRRRASIERARMGRGSHRSAKGISPLGDLVPQRERPPDSRRQPAIEPSPAATLNFSPGEMVTHPLFGPGMVVSSKFAGDDEEVTVAFEGQGVKRLMAKYAKLQRN